MRRRVPLVLTILAGFIPIVATTVHALDANPRLVQAPLPPPRPPRREIDLLEIHPWDTARCREAKEDVKVLDGRLNDPEFANIPTRAEYDVGYGWQRPGGGGFQSSGPTGRERTLETWGENSRQFKEGEAAYEKYVDFNRRAPRTYSKPAMPTLKGSFVEKERQMEEWRNSPSYTYATPESERLWKLYSQRIKIQDTRRVTYSRMLSTCTSGSSPSNPLQDLEDRVRQLEQQQQQQTPR